MGVKRGGLLKGGADGLQSSVDDRLDPLQDPEHYRLLHAALHNSHGSC